MQCVIVANDVTIGELVRDTLSNCRGISVSIIVSEQESVAICSASAPQLIVYATRQGTLRVPLIRELVETVEAPILGVGPAVDTRAILEVMRGGVRQFVDLEAIRKELPQAVQVCRKESSSVRQRGQLICFLSAGGGCGASTVAVNVASVLCKKATTALLDFELESGDLTALLDLQAKHTIADFCRNIAHMDESMFEMCFCRHDSGIAVLPAPLHLDDVSGITTRGVNKATIMTRNRFAYTIADLGVPHRDFHRQLLFQADSIVMVMRMDLLALRQAVRINHSLARQGIPRQNLSVVVNRFRRSKEIRPADIRQALGMPVSAYLHDDPRRMSRSINLAKPLVTRRPRCRVSRELKKLAVSLNGTVPDNPDLNNTNHS